MRLEVRPSQRILTNATPNRMENMTWYANVRFAFLLGNVNDLRQRPHLLYQLSASPGGWKLGREGSLDRRAWWSDPGCPGKLILRCFLMTDLTLLQKTFYLRRDRPSKIIDLGGNILRYVPPYFDELPFTSLFHSPGFLDIQINGAYGFDFSIHEGDDEAYRQGLQMVAERIVETGVTSYVPYTLQS